MTLTQSIIYAGGIHSVSFAVFHSLFWRLFGWPTSLYSVSYVNQAILQIANCRLIYFFLFVAVICFWYPNELANTTLGRAFLIGISLFWLGRTIEQFIFLRRTKHIVVTILTCLFITGAVLFILPLFNF